MGLINKGNAAKLARVVINYPNNADHLWSLDITKTNASIPYEFKKAIKDLIIASKSESQLKINRGFKQITNNLRNKSHSLIWVEHKDENFNGLRYKIDFNHPLIQFYTEEKKFSEKDLRILLETIADNLPVSKIIQNNDDDPFRHDRASRNDELNKNDIDLFLKMFDYKSREMLAAIALQWLLNLEPYCYYENQLTEIVKDKLK